MSNIFALEGPSWVWKTTLATELDRMWVAKRVGEYFHYVQAGETYPGIAPETDAALRGIRAQLYTLLHRREHAMIQIKASGDLPIITERSPLTLLYTEAARIHAWLLWDLPSLADELLALLSSTHQPDYYIFLEVNYLTAVMRLQGRENPTTNFFYQPQTISAIQKLIRFFIATYLRDWAYSIVHNDWDIAETLQETRRILTTTHPIACSAISLLCKDIKKWLDLSKQI